VRPPDADRVGCMSWRGGDPFCRPASNMKGRSEPSGTPLSSGIFTLVGIDYPSITAPISLSKIENMRDRLIGDLGYGGGADAAVSRPSASPAMDLVAHGAMRRRSAFSPLWPGSRYLGRGCRRRRNAYGQSLSGHWQWQTPRSSSRRGRPRYDETESGMRRRGGSH